MQDTSPAPQIKNPEISRRSFLVYGWGAFLAFLAASIGATLRFFMPNVLYEPSQNFAQAVFATIRWASPSIKSTVFGWCAMMGAFAMWARCTHLGCTPNWFPAEARFRCPCHGSNFSQDGDVIAGPAPIPLWRVMVTSTPQGDLIIDKAVMENRPGVRDQAPFFVAI
jgi:cytochrome b6-f complex iron-sulfur subunit